MSNVLDKSFIHRSYPKLAYGSIHLNYCEQITSESLNGNTSGTKYQLSGEIAYSVKTLIQKLASLFIYLKAPSC